MLVKSKNCLERECMATGPGRPWGWTGTRKNAHLGA